MLKWGQMLDFVWWRRRKKFPPKKWKSLWQSQRQPINALLESRPPKSSVSKNQFPFYKMWTNTDLQLFLCEEIQNYFVRKYELMSWEWENYFVRKYKLCHEEMQTFPILYQPRETERKGLTFQPIWRWARRTDILNIHRYCGLFQIFQMTFPTSHISYSDSAQTLLGFFVFLNLK